MSTEIKPRTDEVKTWSANVQVVEWAALKAEGLGERVDLSGGRVLSVQVIGIFGDGGCVKIDGSNTGEHWEALSNPEGGLVCITTPCFAAIHECPRFVRPVVAGGDKHTDIKVVMLVKRENR